jgi:hypothetical protein
MVNLIVSGIYAMGFDAILKRTKQRAASAVHQEQAPTEGL